ncbi:DUF418 domain-containing protein [Nocardiopsis sp. RSe5-2]|uniref:DUF418 domain-containing protein n=1 Tax=Nocardiopsis endophytica TaxID=3018445 RepID=A0ABT4U6G5_9ACTN|nr:DUF418 domain-containing protein [Nocardiopsis endophytica]MDA2812542.1 DUF418 domain-containing protein [Nocardiopsis endophytica]
MTTAPGTGPTTGAAARLGPVPRSERSLAPDLARGGMLLFIALAHTGMALFATVPAFAPDPQGLERAYDVFMFTVVHARALPLFAIMFGYGVVQLALRRRSAGPRAARAVLLRRSAFLFALGLAHGVLLFSGDILGAYGIIGAVLTLVLVGRGERLHRVGLWYLGVAAVYTAVVAAMAAWTLADGSGERAEVPVSAYSSGQAATYGAAVVERLGEWPMTTLMLSAMLLPAWLGAWAARRRILEEPARHRRLLTAGAAAGLTVGFGGGLPMGLFSAGWLHADASAAMWLKLLHESSGLFAGAGFVCLFALASLAHENRRPAAPVRAAVGAVAALGRRSLSGYLVQSVAWLVLFAPFALDLGAAPNPAATALASAVGVWLATVAAAALMERRGMPGPAERVLRRFAYGRPRRA